MTRANFQNRFPIVDPNLADLGRFYDELPLWSAPFGLNVLEHVPMRSVQTILDVGCGTGFLSIELAQRCGARSKVIAIDPWQTAVERLRDKISFLGLTNLDVLQKNAADTDLDDCSVDIIVSNLGINNFDNADQVLAECYRIGRPGSRLFLTSNLHGHMEEFYSTFRTVLIEQDRADWIQSIEEHEDHRNTPEQIKAQLDAAGFETIDSLFDRFRLRYKDGTSMFGHWFVRLAFLRDWMSLIPKSEVDTIFSALEKRLNINAERSGELSLNIPTAYFEARRR